MRRSVISYGFLGSFLTTVFFLQWWQLPAYPHEVWEILGFLGFLGFVGFFFPSATRNAAMILPVICGISLAFTAVSRTTHVASARTVDTWADGKEVSIRGVIVDDADRRAVVTNYTVEAGALKTGSRLLHVSGRVLVTVRAGALPFEYGDLVVVRGKIEKPAIIADFRYDNYLKIGRAHV